MNTITEYTLNKLDSLIKDDITSCVVEKSKDNKNIIKVMYRNKSIYIGSKYSVQRDIENYISLIKELNTNTIFIIFGLGAGEHIVALLNRIGEQNKILIVEPSAQIIKIFYTLPESKFIIDDNRVAILVSDDENTEAILESFIEEFNVNNVEFNFYANYHKLFHKEIKSFFEILKTFIVKNKISIFTNIYHSKQFLKCFLNNLQHIPTSSLVNDLKDKFSEKSAIIVSAGPSLEKNISLLKDAQDKFLIITGGRTLKALLEVGVKPDYVCVIDPLDEYEELLVGCFNAKVPLVFNEYTSYKVTNRYCGPKIFYQSGDLKKILGSILGQEIDMLWQSGSVAHLCTSLAIYLGCDKIIFVGQDLAYTNDKLHAAIAKIDKIDNKKNMTDDLYVADIYGNQVRTSNVLNMFRKAFEDFIKINSNILFINSTEGGANISGTQILPLKDSIVNFGFDGLDKNVVNTDLKLNRISEDTVKLKIKDIINCILNVRTESESGLNYVANLQEYYVNNVTIDINYFLQQITKINKSFNEIEILNQALRPLIYKVLMDYDFIEKLDETPNEKGRRLAEQLKYLYEGIIEIIDDVIPLFNEIFKVKGSEER